MTTMEDGPRFTDPVDPVDSGEGAQPTAESIAADQAESEQRSVQNDISALTADPSIVTLSDGRQYVVERLKTRGMLRLLSILTSGAQDVLAQTKFSLDMDPQEFAGIFIGTILFSIPEQEDATMRFLQNIVVPKSIIDNPRTPQEREANANEMGRLLSLLDDPEPEDTMVILTALITIEAPNILSLGKRVMALLDVQRKSRMAKAGSQPEQQPSSANSTEN